MRTLPEQKTASQTDSRDAFAPFFRKVLGHEPHAWQAELGSDAQCHDRLVRIPTGFGKTAGVVLAWLYHRVLCDDDTWPRRLVFCLPMRVLVEQTERAIRGWLDAVAPSVRVHVLMGGVEGERWSLDPDKPAILLGTQDMLLSRALNRGYGAARGLWPMEFGLLHQDALWVVDEVQLMDVGLATTAQLAAFRDQDRRGVRPRLRPVQTWWMSATLQPRWLETVDRTAAPEPPLQIPAEARRGGLWGVQKPMVRAEGVATPEAIAELAGQRHGKGELTLVIVNRVDTAVKVFEALDDVFSDGKSAKRARRVDAPDLRLVHSRFRGAERQRWADDFMRRDAELPAAGRIVVSTQVVEAGVDISARVLVTELAPWSSLVQRFGRAARYEGQEATVIVVGAIPKDDKQAAPYFTLALAAAHEGLTRLLEREADASPRALEAFEDDLALRAPSFLGQLYPYDPAHLLRRRDLDGLFDTSVDLSGADLDVSRYIRSGDERDVRVFWRDLGDSPGKRLHLADAPRREELCPVPVASMRSWAEKRAAYVFDYLDGEWLQTKRFVPGMTLLLGAADGGYAPERGWDPKAKAVAPVPLTPIAPSPLTEASNSADADDLSIFAWKTVATHGREAEQEARALGSAMGLGEGLARVLQLAARWHDAGKVHEVFQAAIREDARSAGPALAAQRDLAKAPKSAWRRPAYPKRPGFRHELASTLALFELLRCTDPDHPALLGPHRELLALTGVAADAVESPVDHPLGRELAALSAPDFDLLAWLVCSHHGKVRCVWTSTPHDQESEHGGIHGLCEGDPLPSFALGDGDAVLGAVPSLTLSLAPAALGMGSRYGASWADRVSGLLERFGPFALAYLEALLRVADVRASQLTTEDSPR